MIKVKNVRLNEDVIDSIKVLKATTGASSMNETLDTLIKKCTGGVLQVENTYISNEQALELDDMDMSMYSTSLDGFIAIGYDKEFIEIIPALKDK